MHELAITQSVVDAIVARTDGARVCGVHLRIGKLSGVEPESVRFCFDLVCAGTPLEGAWLDIVEPAARARCRDCGREFEPDGPWPLCPCGGADVAVLAGQELTVAAVEVV